MRLFDKEMLGAAIDYEYVGGGGRGGEGLQCEADRMQGLYNNDLCLALLTADMLLICYISQLLFFSLASQRSNLPPTSPRSINLIIRFPNLPIHSAPTFVWHL